jgi:hypothetical protein
MTTVSIRRQDFFENPVSFERIRSHFGLRKAPFSVSNLPANYLREREETGLLARRMVGEVPQSLPDPSAHPSAS